MPRRQLRTCPGCHMQAEVQALRSEMSETRFASVNRQDSTQLHALQNSWGVGHRGGGHTRRDLADLNVI